MEACRAHFLTRAFKTPLRGCPVPSWVVQVLYIGFIGFPRNQRGTVLSLFLFIDSSPQGPVCKNPYTMQFCSLQHQTLLPWPVIFTTGHCFCFGSISSFFLVLFLHFSLVAYWALTDLRSSSLSVLYFCLFILFMGFSWEEYWKGFPVPSPVGQVLSELSTMTRAFWVALHGMAHSFIVRQGCGPYHQFG